MKAIIASLVILSMVTTGVLSTPVVGGHIGAGIGAYLGTEIGVRLGANIGKQVGDEIEKIIIKEFESGPPESIFGVDIGAQIGAGIGAGLGAGIGATVLAVFGTAIGASAAGCIESNDLGNTMLLDIVKFSTIFADDPIV